MRPCVPASAKQVKPDDGRSGIPYGLKGLLEWVQAEPDSPNNSPRQGNGVLKILPARRVCSLSQSFLCEKQRYDAPKNFWISPSTSTKRSISAVVL